MSIDYEFRPISRWPGTMTTKRRSSQFKAGYEQTLAKLEYELQQIAAKAVVIQLSLDASRIRRDGRPYADAVPNHPGVILSFSKPRPDPTRRGFFYMKELTPISMPCDTYLEWRDNLRAIVLSLESLRAVDRYGVTRNSEQYRGWAKLPPPGGLVTPPPMTVEEAAEYLSRVSNLGDASVIIKDASIFQENYRDVARKLHPDTNGGEQRAEWGQLQQAADVLKRHHGMRG